MTQTVHHIFAKVSLVIFAALLMLNAKAQTAPELVFRNAALKSGTANTEGAVYRFSNVTSGVDAELTLKKFSRPDIVMQDVDVPGLGHDKALQPQFGLPGLVLPYQNWYVDFEMSFYVSGTNTKRNLSSAVFTALDVDGDGNSINEFTRFNNPASKSYSPVTALLDSTTETPVFNGSSNSNQSFTCGICSIGEKIKKCKDCKGDGFDKQGVQCTTCKGSGYIFKDCEHPFTIVNQAKGPVMNYTNIDTAATQVMVTYTYQNINTITFRYGASSGVLASNGSGIRLNSMWAKSFSLAPWTMLPVKFTLFNVTLKNADAVLTWETAQDEMLNHFVVQRSTDGKTYTDIATVFTSESMAYAYKDKNVVSTTGVVYYRVVGVDQTKETQTSAVKMIRLTKAENQALAIAAFPNPVVADLRITLPSAWQGKMVVLEIYSANGTVAKTVQAAAAAQTETITLNNLTKGLYVVKATCGGEAAAQRIVKN